MAPQNMNSATLQYMNLYLTLMSGKIPSPFLHIYDRILKKTGVEVQDDFKIMIP
jgi:hypothetical protein